MIACALLVVSGGASSQGLTEANRSVRVPYSDDKAISVRAVVEDPVLIELIGQEPVDYLVRSNPELPGWEIAKREHRVFVRALKEASPVALTVVTKSRSYLFEITPIPATSDSMSKRVGRVVVTAAPVAPSAPGHTPAATPVPAPAAADASAGPRPGLKRNTQYSMQVVSESVDVRPREVFDDGRFTYFRFPRNLEIPAIYRSQPDSREEWLVNSHREGDFVVMQAVAPLWTLRLAGSVLGVFNDAFDAEGSAPVGGATSTSLRRELRR